MTQSPPPSAPSAPAPVLEYATPVAPRTAALAIRDFSMTIAIVVIWMFFTFMTQFKFVGPENLSNLFVELAITAVLALGVLLVILPGQIDLSVGSGVGLFGGLFAVLLTWHHWPAPLAVLVATLAAVGVWLLMGALIVGQRMPAFIITLAGLLIFRGLQWRVINSTTTPVKIGAQENLVSVLTTWYLPPWWSLALALVVIAILAAAMGYGRYRRREFGFELPPASLAFLTWFVLAQLILLFTLVCFFHRGIPLSVLILGATALAIGILTRHTRFGRYLYAIGGNEEAALLSGVPVKKVVITAFGLLGLLVALTGFMQSAYTGGNTTTTGELLELDAIAACVIGGTSLRGGRGTVLGVLFGALIMASLVNGMNFMSVEPAYKYIARGTVLALAVWLDTRLSKG